MHDNAEIGRVSCLKFFERQDHRGDPFRIGRGIGPVSKKTIAEVFVNYAVLILDDLFTTKDPGAEKNVQVLALHLAAEGRKATNVRDEKPTRNLDRKSVV